MLNNISGLRVLSDDELHRIEQLWHISAECAKVDRERARLNAALALKSSCISVGIEHSGKSNPERMTFCNRPAGSDKLGTAPYGVAKEDRREGSKTTEKTRIRWEGNTIEVTL
jgi:hypothetical protein